MHNNRTDMLLLTHVYPCFDSAAETSSFAHELVMHADMMPAHEYAAAYDGHRVVLQLGWQGLPETTQDWSTCHCYHSCNKAAAMIYSVCDLWWSITDYAKGIIE